MPMILGKMLSLVKKRGAYVIWDFDDNIKAGGECDNSSFEFFLRLSNKIIIASAELFEIIPEDYRIKTVLLPSTDGELCYLNNDANKKMRIEKYGKEFVVLWLGTQISLNFVLRVMPQLEKAAIQLQQQGKQLTLKVVCDKPLDYSPRYVKLQNIVWSRNSAYDALKDSHLGIMPLDVSIFTKGKGGFKLIQYISIGLPVIATKVGINNVIVDKNIGYLATSYDDDVWCIGLVQLATNLDFWSSLSNNAQNKYYEEYSFQANLKVWKDIIFSCD